MLNALEAIFLIIESDNPRLMLDSLLEMGKISESVHRIVNKNLPA